MLLVARIYYEASGREPEGLFLRGPSLLCWRHKEASNATPWKPRSPVPSPGCYYPARRTVWAQSGKRLSAREIFYSAPAEPAPVKKAAPQQVVKAKKKVATETASARTTPPAPAPQTSVIPASYTTGATFPLGVRYSILKRAGGESEEVAPDTVFRSGDRIRLRVETNDSGYLYIIHRGSSGNWKPLFPSTEIAEGDNRVEKGRPHEIPSGYVFTFDEQARARRSCSSCSRGSRCRIWRD